MSKSDKNKPRNWVAKHMATFCKPATQKDKKNDYKRKPKHRNKNGFE